MKPIHREILTHALDARFAADLAAGRLGGAAACVYQDGVCQYQRYVGTTVPNGNEPVSDRTLFRLASMTKPITAVAVLLLAEQGRLHLDDPLEKYFPAFRECRLADGGAVATRPTLFHLLTHTSGIGCGAIGAEQRAAMPPEANRDLASATAFYATQGLAFTPFTKQEYSPLAGFDLLARTVELVSDMDFNDFLAAYIFDRCEMKDTTFVPSAEQWSRLIGMHDQRDGHSVAVPTAAGCVFECTPCTHYLGGAGLVSTLSDYVHFAEMLRARGTWQGRRVLGEKWVDLLSSPLVPATVQPGYKRWGLSVRVIVGEGYRVLPVGAYGWSGAYGTHFWIDPKNRITAVYMRNSHYDGGSGSRTSYHFEEDVHSAWKG